MSKEISNAPNQERGIPLTVWEHGHSWAGKALDRELMEHYGEGAENLLWVGVAGGDYLEEELAARRETFAVTGRAILEDDVDAGHSPIVYAYAARSYAIPTVLAFDSTAFIENPDHKYHYMLKDPSVEIRDTIVAAYVLPPTTFQPY